VASNGGKPLWYSEEIALPDIVRAGYPFLNETCFFAVVRQPEEWFHSCEAFMKMQSIGNIFHYNLNRATNGEWAGVPAMALSKPGYFGPASREGDVQTHSAAEGTAGFRRLFVAALPAVSDFLAAFTTVARGEEPPKVVPHANQAPSQLKAANRSDGDASVVREYIAQICARLGRVAHAQRVAARRRDVHGARADGVRCRRVGRFTIIQTCSDPQFQLPRPPRFACTSTESGSASAPPASAPPFQPILTSIW